VSTRVSADGVRSFPTQDRRHNLNLVGSWRAGAYAVGAHFHVASGAPYTPVLGAFGRVVYNPATKQWIGDPADPSTQNIPGDFNSARVPFYDRRIPAPGHARTLLKGMYGDQCLTHGSTDHMNSDGALITHFAPL
jgi:hypothetical protein